MAANWLSLMALVPLSVSMSRKMSRVRQQEGVVAGLLDRGQAVADRGEGGLLDNADLVHFDRDHAAIGQANAHLFLQLSKIG